MPRRKKEIGEHFGLKIFQLKSHIDQLIADGRLKPTDQDNPQNYWQRHVSGI
jgi:predicted ArsR family transcriptional regulator